MNKEKAQRVTFEQLIARAAQREQDKMRVKMIYVPSLDATMLFKKIADDTVMDIMEDAEGNGRKAIVGAYKKLIYLCCQDLQNPELHRELGVVNPYDVIDTLFGLKDIMAIGEDLMELLDLAEAEKEIKNS